MASYCQTLRPVTAQSEPCDCICPPPRVSGFQRAALYAETLAHGASREYTGVGDQSILYGVETRVETWGIQKRDDEDNVIQSWSGSRTRVITVNPRTGTETIVWSGSGTYTGEDESGSMTVNPVTGDIEGTEDYVSPPGFPGTTTETETVRTTTYDVSGEYTGARSIVSTLSAPYVVGAHQADHSALLTSAQDWLYQPSIAHINGRMNARYRWGGIGNPASVDHHLTALEAAKTAAEAAVEDAEAAVAEEGDDLAEAEAAVEDAEAAVAAAEPAVTAARSAECAAQQAMEAAERTYETWARRSVDDPDLWPTAAAAYEAWMNATMDWEASQGPLGVALANLADAQEDLHDAQNALRSAQTALADAQAMLAVRNVLLDLATHNLGLYQATEYMDSWVEVTPAALGATEGLGASYAETGIIPTDQMETWRLRWHFGVADDAGRPVQITYRLRTRLGPDDISYSAPITLAGEVAGGVLPPLPAGGEEGAGLLIIEEPEQPGQVHVVGAPARLAPHIAGSSTRGGTYRKRGYTAYAAETPRRVYRRETASGGFPGLGDLAAKTYSGAHGWRLNDGGTAYITLNTLSADVPRNRLSGQHGLPSNPIHLEAEDWGGVVSPTVRRWRTVYQDGDTEIVDQMDLTLEDEFTTADLKASADTLANSDFDEPPPSVVTGFSGQLAAAPFGPAAVKYLAPDETLYAHTASVYTVALFMGQWLGWLPTVAAVDIEWPQTITVRWRVMRKALDAVGEPVATVMERDVEVTSLSGTFQVRDAEDEIERFELTAADQEMAWIEIVPRDEQDGLSWLWEAPAAEVMAEEEE
jgi:hypothetical protein